MELNRKEFDELYKSANQELREKLKRIFPVTERILTVEDAIIELGENHPDVVFFRNNEEAGWPSKSIRAHSLLKIIKEALNEGEVAGPEDFSKNSKWCIPILRLRDDDVQFASKTAEPSEESGKTQLFTKRDERWKHSGDVAERYLSYYITYEGPSYLSGLSSDSFTFASELRSLLPFCYKNKEVTDHAVKHFFDLWVDFLISDSIVTVTQSNKEKISE